MTGQLPFCLNRMQVVVTQWAVSPESSPQAFMLLLLLLLALSQKVREEEGCLLRLGLPHILL